jgi:endo-1,4-beta-D-glucanase Y
MPDSRFAARYLSWYNWFRSGSGPFMVGGKPYAIPNYNFQFNPAYSYNGALTTLSEGQSYGILYALMADHLYDFQQMFLVTLARHELTVANIAASKDIANNGPWGVELIQYYDRQGRAMLDAGRNSLKTMGWLTSDDYSSAGGLQAGISSTNAATDGDLVFIGACLMAWERWGVPDYKNWAMAALTDLANWSVKPATGRDVLTMGPYRDIAGGFHLPYIRSFNAATAVYPVDDQIIHNAEYFTTGDGIRFYRPSGATMPGGLTAQDGAGLVWPKYYVRVNDPFNISVYPTPADAIANTNKVNITSVGSGSINIIPYCTQKGLIGTDPSYMFPNLFRLFAKYDTANSGLWNSLATNAYGDIQYSINTSSTYFYPTYLIGVLAETGARAAFPADNPDYLDQVRVYTNLAYDDTTEAKAVLASTCDFNAGTGKYAPKTGREGSVWRYYVNSGLIPSKLGLPATNKTLGPGNVDTANNLFAVSLTSDSFRWSTGDPCTVTVSGTLPAPLALATTYYIRMKATNLISLHTTQAGAINDTNVVDLTSTGSGTFTIVNTQPTVQWHYRSGAVPIEGFSPYNAAAIMAQVYALNGANDANDIYNQWPSWLKTQANGSFVENNTDYYVQHVAGLTHAVIGGNGDYAKQGQNFIVGLTQSAAQSLISRINAVIPSYGTTPLVNGSNQYGVKILGPKAYGVLTSGEKTAAVKILPAGYKNVA